MNHRCWGDFFVHDIVAGTTANYLSRFMVGLIFPPILIWAHFSRAIWFFRRGSVSRNASV